MTLNPSRLLAGFTLVTLLTAQPAFAAPLVSAPAPAAAALSTSPTGALIVHLPNRRQLWLHPVSLKSLDPETRTANRSFENPDGVNLTAQIREEIAAGGIIQIQLQDSYGNTYTVDPNSLRHIRLNEDGSIDDGIFTEARTGLRYHFRDGILLEGKWTPALDFWETGLAPIERDSSAMVVSSALNGAYATQIRLGQGFWNLVREGTFLIQELGKSGAVQFGLDLLLSSSWASQMGVSQGLAVLQAGQDRYDFFKGAGYTDGESLGWAVYLTAGDFIGYTPILEAITGVDSITGEPLTGWERVAKAGLGLLSVVGTAASIAPILRRTTQLLPQYAARLKILTQELNLANEAGFVRLLPGTRVFARNNPAVLVPEEVVASSVGEIYTYTVGELRRLLGLKGPFRLWRTFDTLDDLAQTGSKFKGAWTTVFKYVQSNPIARKFLNLEASGNTAAYRGLIELADDVRLFISRVKGPDGSPRGIQFFIDNAREMFDAGKARALLETVEAMR